MSFREVPLKLTWTEIIILLENIDKKERQNPADDEKPYENNTKDDSGCQVINKFEDL